MTLHPEKHLFTVEEYRRMARAGIFGQDDRVELIEGEIIHMTPIGSRHAGCVNWLNRAFSRIQEQCIVAVQSPIVLSERSEPQPDLALLKLRDDLYRQGHARPDEVLLVVEVAETSSSYDRSVKIPLYARADIREAWLVNLETETITVYREPAPQGYRLTETLRSGEHVFCLTFPELKLSVDDPRLVAWIPRL